MNNSSKISAAFIAKFAVLFTIVVLLQLFGGYIKIGTTSLNFVLVPIVVGGIILGPIAGLALGFISGVIVLICGVTGVDVFTLILFTDHPFLTALVCIGKGILSGLIPALVYKALRNKREKAGVVLASLLAPIINTSVFILGALLMSDTLSANFVPSGQTVLYFLVIVCAGINFLVEFAINIVLSPSLSTIISAVAKKPKRTDDSEEN